MTKAERTELERIIKGRRRVATRRVEQRKADLLADAEQRLAAEYKFDDEAWADVTKAADEAVKDADAIVAAKCRERGIPPEFRPSLHIEWHRRGENLCRYRRTELRKVAQTRIDSMARGALLEIETSTLDGLTQLATGALESHEARQFLEAMPSVEALMPAIDVAELGPLALAAETRSAR